MEEKNVSLVKYKAGEFTNPEVMIKSFVYLGQTGTDAVLAHAKKNETTFSGALRMMLNDWSKWNRLFAIPEPEAQDGKRVVMVHNSQGQTVVDPAFASKS